MSKVAVFTPPSLASTFELVLSRIKDLEHEWQRLDVLYCGGSKFGCRENYFRSRSLCEFCSSLSKNTLENMFSKNPNIKLIQIGDLDREEKSGTFLKVWQSEARTTLLTDFRIKHETTKSWAVKYFSSRFLLSIQQYSSALTRTLINFLEQEKVDRLEFFNGRVAPNMTIRTICENYNVPYIIIEVPAQGNKFDLSRNEPIHSLEARKKKIFAYIDRQDKKKFASAPKFFENKRAGRKTNDVVYSKPESGTFPEIETFENTSVIGIFTSSLDEFEFLGEEWMNDASADPLSFIDGLRDSLPSKQYSIIVRMHPNQKYDKTGASEKFLNELRKVQGVNVIPPDDQLSSYDVLKISDYIITFGSTIGVEATYSGKLSILAGRSQWEELNIAYQICCYQEAAELIRERVPAKPKDDCLAYAHFLMNYGEASQFLTRNLETGEFFVDGRNFKANRRSSTAYMVKRVSNRLFRNAIRLFG